MEHLKSFLLIGSFFLPLALSVVLFIDSKNNTSRRLMAYALLNTGIAYFCSYFYFVQAYDIYIPLHSLHVTLELWIFPSIYLYLKSIVIADNKLKDERKHFYLGVLMFIIASWLFYVYIGKDDLLFFLKNNKLGFQFEGYKFQVLIVTRYMALTILATQAIYYSIAFLIIPKEYDERLKNEFSNIDNFSIHWINKYNISFGVCGVLGFVFYTFTPIKGTNELIILTILGVFSAYVSTMGLVALKQQKPLLVYGEEEEEGIIIVPISKFEIANEKARTDELIMRLVNYMELMQPFLQPELSLTQVSKELGTNRTHLSMIINLKFEQNFNAYINQYRVKYIIEYVNKNPNTTREQLANIGGFGSVRTMSRALKVENN